MCTSALADNVFYQTVNGYVNATYKPTLAYVLSLQLAGFPNVIGCIDGTYIPVRCPVNKVRSTYINRHDQVSITT